MTSRRLWRSACTYVAALRTGHTLCQYERRGRKDHRRMASGLNRALLLRNSNGLLGGPSLPLFGGPNRPNRVSGVPVRTSVSPGDFDPATDRHLNINAFSDPAPFTRGNIGPRQPDARNFTTLSEDFSLFKFIPFTESMRLEFRAEFYKPFNRAVFSGPGTNFNSPAGFGVRGRHPALSQADSNGVKFHF